jgi:hypothetical protein
MRKSRLYSTIALLLLVSSSAFAQGFTKEPERFPGNPFPNQAQVQLTQDQKSAILTAVRDTKIPPPSSRFDITIGGSVPPSIELYALPIAALSQAPETRTLRYTMVQNQVVLVDPTNMKIVEVIR